jgi:hypothetical protein
VKWPLKLAGSKGFKELGLLKARRSLTRANDVGRSGDTRRIIWVMSVGDLSRRRGIIQGMEDYTSSGKQIIRAEVPLAEMFGYATECALG